MENLPSEGFVTTVRNGKGKSTAGQNSPRGGSRRPASQNVKSLAVEPDILATKASCVLVRGNVSTAAAEVFVGPLRGYPEWIPILTAANPPVPTK